jgi:hypothetical protein
MGPCYPMPRGPTLDRVAKVGEARPIDEAVFHRRTRLATLVNFRRVSIARLDGFDDRIVNLAFDGGRGPAVLAVSLAILSRRLDAQSKG